MNLNPANNLEIAKTIVSQLGGTGKLRAMTGAKDFVAIDNGIQFKIGKNSEGVNLVRVVLNGSDLYDMEFGRVRKQKGIPTYKPLKTEDDLYNDMLVASFERNTGMYLTLF
jgi:hypothetical protein